MESNDETGDFPSVSKCRIYKNIIVVGFGFLFLFTAFQALQNLQSSIHSDPRLGLASLSVVYASIVISCMFVPPIAIGKLGCKYTMMLSMAGYLLYTGANFYPRWWTLIPASAILGMCGAPLWSSKCTYVTSSGITYGRAANIPEDHIVTNFFGIFFLIFQSGQIWGNLISSQVLKETDAPSNSTFHDVAMECGARFCPATTTASQSHNLSDSTIYTLLSIYLGFGCLAIAVVALFLDKIKIIGDNSSKGVCDLFVATIKHLRQRDMQLLIPLTIFSGLEQGFVFADFTKAFVTCAIGIDKVGLIMIVFGAVDASFSLFLGKIVEWWTGRPKMMFISAFVNLSLLVTFSIWEPNSQTLYIYFLGAALWGFSDAVWQTQVNAFYGVIFPTNQEAAFSNYRLWESLGFVISFAYGNYLCVYVKLYILMAVLIVGISFYGIIEYRHKKKSSLSNVNSTSTDILEKNDVLNSSSSTV